MKAVLISACLLGTACRYDGKSKGLFDMGELSRKYRVIPICPECDGGLPVPRNPSERVGERVLMCDGTDVTDNYMKGAERAYELAVLYGAEVAVLKERSPSCGSGEIYDGSFSRTLTEGDGVTAEYLKARGITVIGETGISELEKILDKSGSAK